MEPNEMMEYRAGLDTAHGGDLLTEHDLALCRNCQHSKEAHWDKFGCTVEGPDDWVDGEAMGGWVARGPCCCKDYTPACQHSGAKRINLSTCFLVCVECGENVLDLNCGIGEPMKEERNKP